MIKKLVSLIMLCAVMISSFSMQVFAEDTVFINDNFENSNSDNWWDNTGRGEKNIERTWRNKYLALTSNSDSFYNYQAKDIYSTGILYCDFDIQFNSGDMEIQLRESRDVSATGFTMAGRIRKVAYYLEYFSNGEYYKMTSYGSNDWFTLNDTSKWYTIKMSFDIKQNKYNIYLLDRETEKILSQVENIDFYGDCDYINYFAFSSTGKLCVDNVDIRELDIDNIKISGEIYPTIPSWGNEKYSYNANSIRNNSSNIIDDVKWSIVIPKDGISINESTGVLTVTSAAEPGPVMLYVEKEYQPFLNTTFLIDLER